MKIIVLTCLLFLIPHLSVLAQEVNEVPIQFHQFFRNYALINPAASGLEKRLEFYLTDKSYTGEFKGVNKICANANYALQFDTTGGQKTKHVVGITFFNDKIGSYIGRSRAYASYSMHLPISSDWRLNAGSSVGFVNYYYLASALFPGRSAMTPTADVGLWLYGKKWNMGLSANQLFSNNISPYHSEILLTRYLNFNLDKNIDVNPYLTIKPALWVFYVNKDNHETNLAILFIFQKLFSAGASYKYDKGYTLYLGLEKISIGGLNLKWMASYYNRLKNSNAYEIQSIEFSLLLQGNSFSKKYLTLVEEAQ